MQQIVGSASSDRHDTTQERVVGLVEALDLLPWGRFHWLLFATCGLGYAADMVELLMLGFALPEIGKEWELDKITLSTASLFSNLGIMVGAAAWGALSDVLGRRLAFLGSVALTFACGLGSAFSTTFWAFVLCRFFVGCGLGGNLAVDYVIFLEFVPSRLRDSIMMLLTMWGVLGVLVVAVSAWLLIESAGWRVYVGVMSLPSLVLLALRLSVPESPVHLYTVGKPDEALQVLQYIAEVNGTNLPVGLKLQPATADEAISEASGDSISTASVSSHGKGGVYWKVLQPIIDPTLRFSTLLLGTVWFAMNIAYGGFTLWFPFFMEGKGISGLNVYRTYTVMVLAEVPGLVAATSMVRAGWSSKCVLASCACGCGVTLACCALVNGEAAVTAVSASNYFFSVSTWATLYLVTPQSYPAWCRSTACGLIRVCGSVGGLLKGPIGAWLLGTEIWTALLTYAGCYGLIALTVALMLPAKQLASSETAPADGIRQRTQQR